jgi:D-alanine-D-alanine ligase
MRIGLAYNEKPDLTTLDVTTTETYVEWDDASTIAAVEQALRPFGDVIRLEADNQFPKKLARARPDLVFNIAEGTAGVNRESHVPAICEFIGVPYTGSDPLTLGLTLHKARAKEILAYRGVPTAPFALIERPGDLDRLALHFPLFVKPVAEGSGKGIFGNNLCRDRAQLRDRVLFLLERYAQPVLVESYLPGAEYTVAILGNGPEARCLPIVALDFETLPTGATPVYGFEAKWVWDTTARPLDIFRCPAPLPDALYRDIERAALDAFQVLGCRDWCRIDVRIDRFGVPNVVELNPLPGILPDPAMNSCFPKAARTAGLSYDELIQSVVRIAWRRITGAEPAVSAADDPRLAVAGGAIR